MAFAACALSFVLPLFAIGCGETRDALANDPVAKPSAANGATGREDYEILLHEGPIAFGLAEARGADREKLADYTRSVFVDVRNCLAAEHAEGRTKSGAARLVIVVDEAGHDVGHKLAVDSVAANGHAATLCFEVPILARPLPFAPVPPKDREGRGFAFDLRW